MKEHEVVAGADRSDAGQGAADWAAQRADGLGLQLHLVRVVPDRPYFRLAVQYAEAVAEARAMLDLEGGRLAARYPALRIATSWQPGEPAPVLSQLSVGAEMVVLGSDRSADRRGEGFGSVSFQAAVLCRSPVAAIPAPRAGSRTGVVVGIDGSDDSEVALKMAAGEASRRREALTVLHAVPKGMAAAVPGRGTGPGRSPRPDPLTLVSEAAGRLREHFPALTVLEALIVDGAPADELIRAAEQANLLVIGCWGRGGLRKPVGSIAEKVLMQLPCPTIITRPASQPGR